MIFECTILLLITLGYQYVSRNWIWIQYVGLAGTIFAFIISAYILPESPKFLYVWNRFQESKQVLSYIATYNSSNCMETPFVFDTENLNDNKDSESQPLLKKKQEENKTVAINNNNSIKVSDSQYQWNLLKMTIMWSTTVFATYLLMFQLKYLKGNIFQNTKSYAISDGVSRMCGGIFFARFGFKKTFIMAYIISIIGGVGIYIV